MPYEFNGEQYGSREEAEQAKTQYDSDKKDRIAATYADAASVGFDEGRFNALMASGTGLSQMSKEERAYIQDRYAKSGALDKYTKSATDQYLMSVGLPSAKSLASYRKKYGEYSASGGFKDNYGGVSEAQWQKINELWQKDWEYGLTDADAQRKTLGLAPVAYDDMYEDTQLDDELRALGLPPSKLLKGKLGETYNAWVKDDDKFNEIMSAFVRNVLKNNPVNVGASSDRAAKSDGLVANAANTVSEMANEISMGQLYDSAYAELLQNPEYAEFLSSHGYTRETLPSETDEKYQLKDEYGQPIDGEYDYQKWNEDYQKAIIKNAKIDDDEFAITREAAEAYYDKHAQDILIEDAAREYLTTNNIDIQNITDEQANSALSYAIGQALSPMTFENLFGEADLTDEDRVIYQPVIDEYNRLMKSEGIDAANSYLGSEQYKEDINASIRQNIISTYRASFAPGSPNANKSDDEIYGMYVDDIAHEYAITDSEIIAKMKSGDMSLYDYLSQTCASEEGASDLANRQFVQFCADNYIPMKDGEVDWETLRVNRQKNEDAYNYLAAQKDLVKFTPYLDYLYKNDASDLIQWRDEFQAIVDNHKPGDDDAAEYLNAEEQIAYIDRVLRIRSEAEAIDPNYYKYRTNIFGSSEHSMRNHLYYKKVGYQYDALAYTDEYKSWVENTSNEYVNQRFDEIVSRHADSLTHAQDEEIASYAADEEKYKTVYVFDKMGRELPDGRKVTNLSAEYYLNETLMRKWDAARRDDQKQSTGFYGGQYWGSESESGFVRWAGATGTTLAHIFLGIGEGVANLGTDTATVLSGHTIYSSNRANSSSDRMESLSQHLNEIDGNGVGAFFVQLIPSMAQSAAAAIAAWATGGTSLYATAAQKAAASATEWLTLALMSTQSYSEGVDTALSRGASTGDAYAFGLAQGFAEMLFEKVSLDSMLEKMDDATLVAIAAAQSGATKRETIKQVSSAIFKNALAQGFVAEGTEELFTEIAGWVNEAVFLGYNSTSFAEAVNAYVKSGYTQEQAEAMAGKELWKEALVAYIGGAVSGLLMSGPTSYVSIQSSANYALARLESDAKNLSAISYDRAVDLAKEVAITDANGNVTKEGAQAIVSALRAKGADSAAISYVMNSIETTEDVRGVFDSAILEMRRSESARLAKAATDVVARSQSLSKLEAQRKLNYMRSAATNYITALTETLQTADKSAIAKAVETTRNGFLDVVKRESGIAYGEGMRIVGEYMRTIREDELNKGAVPYVSAMKVAALKSNVKMSRNAAAYYGAYAYALTKMAGDENFLSAFSAMFGKQTADISTNVRNACLNSAQGDSIRFVDDALAAIGMYESMGNSSISKVLGRGMNGAAFVTSMLAACEASPATSDSRLLYNYTVRHGVTGSVLDTMAITKYYENMPAESRARADKYAQKGSDAFMTAEETDAESGAVESAEENVKAKAKAVQAQKVHNDQTLATSQNIVERHKASYDAVTASETVVIDGKVLQTTAADLADVATSYRAALNDAINARNNLAKANEDRLQGAQNDLDLAQKKLLEARRQFKAKMNRHAAAYKNMIGCQLETLRSGNVPSSAEFDRITALANYGTREDLNNAVQRIIQTEKRQAAAFAAEIGSSVEIVKFTPAFLKSIGATYDPNTIEYGYAKNGKAYLNEDGFGTNKGAHVGYGTNSVILHEIGHIAELSANNWTAYSKYAVKYMLDKHGARAQSFMKSHGKNGVRELTAEFTRNELMQNQDLIVDLCKNAPMFSIRMHQWLKSVTSSLTGSLTNTSKYNKAERMFAKALGEANESVRNGSAQTKTRSSNNDNVQTETRKNTEKAIAANNEMVEANKDAVAKQDEKARVAQKEKKAQPERYTPEPPPENTGGYAYGEELDELAKAIDKPQAYTEFNIEQAKKSTLTKEDWLDLVGEDDGDETGTLSKRPIWEDEGFTREDWKDLVGEENDSGYTELRDSINSMPRSVRERCGNPRLMQGTQGILAVRNVSLDGFLSRDQQGRGARNIAVLERADKYASGQASLFLSPIDLENTVAVVSPSGREFGDVRNAAWENNATVVTYDLNDPSTFENAIRSAAQADGDLHAFHDFNSFIEQYGAFDEEETRRTGGRLVPKQTKSNNRVHRTLHTIANSQYTTDAQYENGIKPYIENDLGSYDPVSNSRTLGKARSDIARLGGVRGALAHLNDSVATNTGKNTELLAMAESILMDADAMRTLGREEYEQLLTDISLVAEDSGRSLQLLRELASLSPQGRINHIEQTGKRMAAKYEQKTKKPVDLSLTDEEKKAYDEAKTQDEFDAIDEAVTERWGQQTKDLPLLDRIRNWRYFSMLGNARTHFRNIVGNLMMYDVARAKDSIKSLYEGAFGVEKQDRTATFWTKRMDDATKAFVERETQIAIPLMQNASMKYYQAAKKFGNADSKMTWKRFVEEATRDVKSAHISNSSNLLGRSLNKLSSFNSNVLELEDAFSLGKRFRSVLAQQIQAKDLDVSKIPEWQKTRMIQYAMEESLRATFRDASVLADALNKFENTNAFTKFVMGAIMPFKKTPINIVKRGVEYSPLGLVHGLYKAISNKVSYSQKLKNIDNSNLSEAAKKFRKSDALTAYKNERLNAINRLAEGTTGTLLAAIGLIAAKLGWISIGRKDDDQAAFETALGKNSYSLNIGDVSIDLSAFSPAAIPLLMGAAAYEAFDASRTGDESFVPELVTALTETLDPITEMTMLSGIADAMSGLSYSNNDDAKNTQWAGTLARNTAASFVSQFIPTLVGQVARIADPYTRSYSAGKDYWASKYIGAESGSKVKSLQNKIPFVAWLSEPKVDLHGNPVGNYTNWGAGVLNVLNNTILPATIKVDKKNEIDEELVRLYGVVDSSEIFPTKPSRSIGSYKDKNGDTVQIKLNNDAEYTEYQMEVGQVTYDALNDLMQSPAYARMDDTQKASAVENVIKNARNSVKKLWKAKKQSGK